jgi:hypothetical protein
MIKSDNYTYTIPPPLFVGGGGLCDRDYNAIAICDVYILSNDELLRYVIVIRTVKMWTMYCIRNVFHIKLLILTQFC